MKKLLLAVALLCAYAYPQTINPNQIRPGSQDGEVLTTVTANQPPSWQQIGATVNVNGSPVSNPNFNSASPAADSGFTPVTWKVISSNVLGEVQQTSSNVGSQCFVGVVGLLGAFSDSSGVVKQPLCIGAGPITFTVPTGATELLLGINTGKQADNTGSFAVNVSVNGGAATPVTVVGTSKVWDTTTNPSLVYGINDGTGPTVAVTGLSSGDSVTVIASGIVGDGSGGSAGPNGESKLTTNQPVCFESTYCATKYMTSGYLSGAITALTGDVTATGPGSVPATVVKVNGGSVPVSSLFLGTNGSGQPVTATTANLASFLSGLTGCATAAFAYVPADSQCEAVGGGGGGGISGLTAGHIPLAGSATTLTVDSHIDEVTVAGEDTITQPVNIAATSSPSQTTFTYNPSHPLTPGSSTAAAYGVDSGGKAVVSEAGGAASEVCTSANGVCTGSGGALVNITNSLTATGCTISGGVCTVGTAVASITISSIPTTYKDLRVAFSGSNSTSTSHALVFTVNGDTGSNYYYTYMHANAAAAPAATSGTAVTAADVCMSGATGTAGGGEILLLNYASSKDKIFTATCTSIDATSTFAGIWSFGAYWTGTSAITQFTIAPTVGNFEVGDTIVVRGVN